MARDDGDDARAIERHPERAKSARRSPHHRPPLRLGDCPIAGIDGRDDLIGEIGLIWAVSDRVDELAPSKSRHTIGERQDEWGRLAADDLLVEELDRILLERIVAHDPARRAGVTRQHQDERQGLFRLIVARRKIDDHLARGGIAERIIAEEAALKDEPFDTAADAHIAQYTRFCAGFGEEARKAGAGLIYRARELRSGGVASHP